MSKAARLGLLAALAIAVGACGSPRNPSSAPAAARSSTTTTTAPPTTTAPTLPPETSAEQTLLTDLVTLKTATATASSTFASMQADSATGSTYSPDQSAAVTTPVANALTVALNQLTATRPTLPNNALLTQTAGSLSSGLADDLTAFKTTATVISGLQSAGNVSGSAAVSSAVANDAAAQALGGYNVDVSAINTTIADFVPTFVDELGKDVNLLNG